MSNFAWELLAGNAYYCHLSTSTGCYWQGTSTFLETSLLSRDGTLVPHLPFNDFQRYLPVVSVKNYWQQKHHNKAKVKATLSKKINLTAMWTTVLPMCNLWPFPPFLASHPVFPQRAYVTQRLGRQTGSSYSKIQPVPRQSIGKQSCI